MHSLTREMMLLCKSVQYCAARQASPEWAHDGIEINKLIRLVRWHGVLGIVMPYLEQQGDQVETLSSGLKPMLAKKVILETLRLEQLNGLVSAFDKQHINYVLFKGLAAKAQMWDSPVSIKRFSADIDLLVDPSDFPQLVSIMHERGYYCIDCDNALDVASFAAHSADSLTKRGLVFRHRDRYFADVDVHWRVTNTFSLPLETSMVLEQKRSMQLDGVRACVPSFEHHFIILTIHGYLDHFFQLKHLADLYFARQHIEYNESRIFALAEELGVRRQLQESIELLGLFFSGAEDQTHNFSSYVQTTMKRYRAYEGLTPRAHKTNGQWTLLDKFTYILRQINTRSRKACFIAPIQNRLLVKFHQVPKPDSVRPRTR